MPGYDPVLFDLDGTVVDTVELITESFRHASRVVLGSELPDEQIMAYVGQPLMQQMRQLSPEHAQQLYDVYREYNHRRHDELIRSYAGIEAALLALRAAGRRLGLVTSKSADTTEMAFRAVGMREHFDAVVTASDTTTHKPSPEPLLLCLERLAALRPGEPLDACQAHLHRRQPVRHPGRPRGRHGDGGRHLGYLLPQGAGGAPGRTTWCSGRATWSGCAWRGRRRRLR